MLVCPTKRTIFFFFFFLLCPECQQTGIQITVAKLTRTLLKLQGTEVVDNSPLAMSVIEGSWKPPVLLSFHERVRAAIFFFLNANN